MSFSTHSNHLLTSMVRMGRILWKSIGDICLRKLFCRSAAAPHTCRNLDGGKVRAIKFADAQHKEKGADQNGNDKTYQRRDNKSAKVEGYALSNQFLCSLRMGSQSN